MKILYVITGLAMGGAENVVVNLANKFNVQGHKVKIVYMTGDLLVNPDSEVEVESLNMKGGMSIFSALFLLKNIIYKFQADVVHSHMYHANILSRACKLLSFHSFKLISTAHSSNEGGWGRMLSYRMSNFISNSFTNVSCEAVQIYEKKGAVSKGGMLAISNGICTDKFSKLSSYNRNEIFRLIAIGRLDTPKDYPNLLLSLKYVKDAGYDFVIDIVGDGVLKEELQELSKSYGLEDYVNWLGIRHDIPKLLNQSDLFVLSSAWEGFGLVVAEAMACEVPVVATDCGGVKEVVGNTDLLVPIKSPEVLAKKIKTIMNMSHSDREELGQSLRSRVVINYSLDAMCDKYEKLYLGK